MPPRRRRSDGDGGIKMGPVSYTSLYFLCIYNIQSATYERRIIYFQCLKAMFQINIEDYDTLIPLLCPTRVTTFIELV